MKRASLPPGHQPYDPLNGIRVGGFLGAVVGGGLGFVLPFVPVGGGVLGGLLVGAVVGYRSQRRRMQTPN